MFSAISQGTSKLKYFVPIAVISTAQAKQEVSNVTSKYFLPKECAINCETPYGKLIGTSHNVEAFSNCSPQCVNIEKVSIDKYTKKEVGIAWQCVEYTRRWLMKNQGVTFDSIDSASDLWNKNYVTRLENNNKINFKNLENGGNIPPKLGDILVYEKTEDLIYGHVAVVVNVNLTAGYVDVAEENYENKMWEDPNNYSRRIKLETKDEKYLISDVHYQTKTLDSKIKHPIYGWKRVVK